MAFIVIYDANVLYPNTLRDLLIRIAPGRAADEGGLTGSARAGSPSARVPA
jgi:hypothetical protein